MMNCITASASAVRAFLSMAMMSLVLVAATACAHADSQLADWANQGPPPGQAPVNVSAPAQSLEATDAPLPNPTPEPAEDPEAVDAPGRKPAGDLKGKKLAAAVKSVAMIEISSLGDTPDVINYHDVGTGFLISPCLVVTARHVIAPSLTPEGRDKTGIKVHFGLGGDGSDAPSPFAATVVAYGGSSGESRGTIFDDWAVLKLETPYAGADPLKIYTGSSDSLRFNTQLALAGFPADLFDAANPKLWVDPNCAITDVLVNRVIATSCHATSGNSGGPVLAKVEGAWQATAILVRADPAGVVAMEKAGRNFSIPIDRYLQAKFKATESANSCTKVDKPNTGR